MVIFKRDEEKKLIKAINNYDIKKVKLIIENANKNEIKLNLNLNLKNKKRSCHFIYACDINNIELIQLLIDYSNQN